MTAGEGVTESWLGPGLLDRRDDPGARTTGAYLTDWLEAYAKPTVRRSTYESYSAVVRRHLIPELGRVPLAQLQPEHVSKALSRITERGTLSPTTVRYCYKVLRIALGRAVKLGRVHRNVCTLIDPPKVPRRELQPMSAEEARRSSRRVRGDRLEAAVPAGARHRAATGRAAGAPLAGRRPRGRHARRAPHTAAPHPELVEPKTAKARRYAALDDATVALLRAHRAAQSFVRLGEDYCFTTATGGPLDPRNVLRSFHAATDRAGLPRQPFHHLRHACATLLLESAEELANISKLLGHADLGTTADLYGHLTPQIARRASERMGAILAG